MHYLQREIVVQQQQFPNSPNEPRTIRRQEQYHTMELKTKKERTTELLGGCTFSRAGPLTVFFENRARGYTTTTDNAVTSSISTAPCTHTNTPIERKPEEGERQTVG